MSKFNISFLFPDDIHFHRRSFKTLFDFLDKHKIPCTFLREHRELKLCYGDYSKQPKIDKYVDHIKTFDPQALYSYSHAHKLRPIRIYPLVQTEALSYLLATRENWYGLPLPGDAKVIFGKMYTEDRQTLLSNMAAAMLWIDYLDGELARLPNFTHCCIFGGCAIYTKVLTKLLMATRTKVIMMESCFTGNEYYFEEKYEPISNNCDIRFPTVFRSISLPEDPNLYDRERTKAINRVLTARNKNVSQPAEIEEFEPFPCPERDTILVIGQVQNDFSLLESRLPNINSIYFYKTLIQRLLDRTKVNILFKAHPWERKKAHLLRPLTRMEIERFRNSLIPDKAKRIRILEDSNICKLFDLSEYVITLNSQSAIEAAFYSGLKPIVFGNPFYGGKGFTSDYTHLDDFLEDFSHQKIKKSLSIPEYQAFEEFLTKWLQCHLITTRPVGVHQLETRLSVPQPIPLAVSRFTTLHPNTQPRISNDVNHSRRSLRIFGSRLSRRGKSLPKLSESIRKFRIDPGLFFRERRPIKIHVLQKIVAQLRRFHRLQL
ncbi:MAG: hypothetical protein MN733_40115 [Nitrososphaera sp.]|nr:hypothetical protein [Nitrososphaera sp.]